MAIENAIRESPLMLVNTDSGRLLDKYGQVCSFESQPIFRELISSMTTHIDHVRIEREVAEYYHYATFSYNWEDNEPLFEKLIRIAVYDLDESLTHDKLHMFCKLVLGMERYIHIVSIKEITLYSRGLGINAQVIRGFRRNDCVAPGRPLSVEAR